MLENDGRPPSKAEQVREAQDRNPAKGPKTAAPAKVVAQETPPEPIADLAAPELDLVPPARGPAPKIDADAAKTNQPPGKVSRDEITARFRRQRKEDESGAKEDLAEFNQEGFPIELTEQVSHEPVQAVEDEEPPQPVVAVEPEPEDEEPGEPVYVIKVRGKEIELTEAQLEALADKVPGEGTVVERAQKAAAGDDYLRESRALLDETKRLLETAQRGSPHAKHPGAQEATRTTEPATAEGETVEHPDDPFAKAVEAIQFGQPEEAAKILREAVTRTTATQAKGVSEDTIVAQQMNIEQERADRAGRAFEEANQELAKDPFARDAIINQCIRLQVEDLRGVYQQLGIDEATLPFPKTNEQVIHYHKFYRTKGLGRDPTVLLNAAKDSFVQWKGGDKPAATDPAVQSKAKPRVEISVERRVRRAAIPQQPSRTVSPKPDVRQQQPVVKDRSAIVQEMKQQRMTPRLPPKQVARAVN